MDIFLLWKNAPSRGGGYLVVLNVVINMLSVNPPSLSWCGLSTGCRCFCLLL
jgi:hypothetical protein